MPIVREGMDVRVEYEIPANIKDLIDREFLITFRNELLRIFDYWSLDTFEEDGIPMNTSTSGWAVAFGKACITTHKEAIYKYWKELDWYDSDIFDGIIADMMIEEGVILKSLYTYTKKYLGIDEDKIDFCCDCFDFYPSNEGVLLSKEESKDELSSFRCKHCEDKKNGLIGEDEEFHDDILSKLEPYVIDIVSDELSINKDNLVRCSKCGKLFSRDMGVYNDEKFTCHYCNDKANSKDSSFNVTDYYLEGLEEIKNIK